MLRSQRYGSNALALSWRDTSATCELSIACSFCQGSGAGDGDGDQEWVRGER